MSPSANHKPRLSMWGILLTLAQLPPNANNCNVLATIKHSTQIPDIRTHTQACAKKNKKKQHILDKSITTHTGNSQTQE